MGSAPEKINTAHVLLAEDDLHLRQALVNILTKMGCQVDAVENGRQAVEACEERTYDLILMDGEMPEMNGLEATQAIRQTAQGADTPVIGVSGARWISERECIEAGMDYFVRKPFSREDIRRVLRGFLAGRQ